MRNRINNVTRDHSIIKGVVPILEKISKMPEVNSVVTGRIKPIKGNYPKPILELKVNTPTGFKCIAKSSRSVQEVFITTSHVERVIEILRKEKLLI